MTTHEYIQWSYLVAHQYHRIPVFHWYTSTTPGHFLAFLLPQTAWVH